MTANKCKYAQMLCMDNISIYKWIDLFSRCTRFLPQSNESWEGEYAQCGGASQGPDLVQVALARGFRPMVCYHLYLAP